MNTVVISLGSNVDPQKNIEQARTFLKERFTFLKESAFIQTKPIGYVDQDDFVNGSVLIETEEDQNKLKETLKGIEQELGRIKSAIKFGPRTIDLDIVVFNGKVVDQDFYDRDFVKNAVLELIPELKY